MLLEKWRRQVCSVQVCHKLSICKKKPKKPKTKPHSICNTQWSKAKQNVACPCSSRNRITELFMQQVMGTSVCLTLSLDSNRVHHVIYWKLSSLHRQNPQTKQSISLAVFSCLGKWLHELKALVVFSHFHCPQPDQSLLHGSSEIQQLPSQLCPCSLACC